MHEYSRDTVSELFAGFTRGVLDTVSELFAGLTRGGPVLRQVSLCHEVTLHQGQMLMSELY